MSAPASTHPTSGSQKAAMDRMYRLTRHIYDATRKPYLLGRDRMIAGLEVPPGGTVLEMGCGTGRNLIAAGRRHPGARLYGFDISGEMLKTARRNVEHSGLEICLAEGDACVFDAEANFGVAQFDRVYFSYTLSMIPDWATALAHGLALVKDGGRLSVVDFGFCEELGTPARTLLHGWLSLFHVTPRADLHAEMARLAKKSGRTLHFERPARGYAQLGTIC
ncbi:class I SAM-dependent methyltransferase [Pleomorphomonas oryzae]|uniref:class I SAM-dependent methyltransferase n=1 Tax=Pleomorphomonas oryzae TaxID=261934 RepID=UPI0003FECC79|nr:class I SAM-dependent methyltransferase [Pleomorphomonas oryzae]